MKKLVCLTIVFALIAPLFFMTADAEEYDAVSFIIDNISDMADVYEQLHPDSTERFSGSSVEFSIPVTIVSSGSVGTYIDFNGDNGYMVVADGNDVLKWEIKGDLSFLKNLESTHYSVIDGFGYYVEDTFVPYVLDRDDVTNTLQDSAYKGQKLAGEGAIEDVSLYILDRYNSHYVLEESGDLDYEFTYVVQSDYSIYNAVDENGKLVSHEGNCGLAAIYAFLRYLKDAGICKGFPSSKSNLTFEPEEWDSIYSKYANKSSYSIVSPVTVPTLYFAVRYWAITNYGYEVGGLYSGYNDDLIDKVASIYNVNADATLYTLGGFETRLKKQIDNGLPVLFSVDLSTTYSSHAMVATGYRIYAKTTTILGIDFKDYVYLIEVNDNWVNYPRYFNFSAFGGTWSFTNIEVA